MVFTQSWIPGRVLKFAVQLSRPESVKNKDTIVNSNKVLKNGKKSITFCFKIALSGQLLK